MFMGRVNGVNLYKHGISRTYLNLDDVGNCFVARNCGSYIPAAFDQELAKLEECLKGLQATLETPYDALFIARKRAVLRQEGIRLLTLLIDPEEVTIQ